MTVPGHRVTLERDGPRKRWVCTCGWHWVHPDNPDDEGWTVYTDQLGGGMAVRHAAQHGGGTTW